jgi:hypothetical protein
MIKARVEEVQVRYQAIEHEAWDGRNYSKSQSEMWIEASQIIEDDWQEIIRVLAQGRDYYSIEWPRMVA